MAEWRTYNPHVIGSNPIRPTGKIMKTKKKLVKKPKIQIVSTGKDKSILKCRRFSIKNLTRVDLEELQSGINLLYSEDMQGNNSSNYFLQQAFSKYLDGITITTKNKSTTL